MPFELSPSLVFAILVLIASLRFVRRYRGFATSPLPQVDDAPPSATPIASPQLNDDGLGTYSLDLPESHEAGRG